MTTYLKQLIQQRNDLDKKILDATIAEFNSTGDVQTTAPVRSEKTPLNEPKAATTAPKAKGKRNDVTGILSKILLAGGDFKPKDLVKKSGLKSTSVSAWLNTEKNKEGGIVTWNEEAGTYSAASSTPAAKAPAKAKGKAKAKPKAGKAKVSKKKA